MELIEKINELKQKKKDFGSLIVDSKSSTVLKFFIDDIIFLEKNNNFTMTEQKAILENVLDIEISYPNYVKFHKINVKPKLAKNEVKNTSETNIKKVDSSISKETKKDENLVDFFDNLNKPKKVKNIEDLINK